MVIITLQISFKINKIKIWLNKNNQKIMNKKRNMKQKRSIQKILHFCEMDIKCGNEKKKTKHKKNKYQIIFCNRIIEVREKIIEL